MGILRGASRLMGMNENVWQRHANPFSVYSRFSILPLFTLSIYMRECLGGWFFAALFLISLWTWLNPRIFPVPKRTNNWASMGTFGERIYLKRKEIAIPKHHLQMCRVLVFLQVLGIPFWFYALYTMDFPLILLSTFWLMFMKMWFVDRMVWLYLEMKEGDPQYQSWLR